MKGIFFFLILIGASASFGLLYLQDPGVVGITWLGYEIQLTAVLAFLLLLLFFFIFILLGQCLSWLLRIPMKWLSFFRRSQKRKAKAELLDLLSFYEAETFTEALKHQEKASPYLMTHPFFLWISGNIFEKSENHLEAEKCFLTLTENPRTAFLGLKGQIRAAMHRRDVKTAYELLIRAQKVNPTSPWVLKHLLALTREQKNLKEAETLVLRLEDLGYIAADESKKQMAHLLYQQALECKSSETDKEVLLRQSHFLNPSSSEVTEALAFLLQKQGHITYALTALEATWALTPTQSLGDLYIKIASPKTPLEAFQEAQTLVKNNPQHPESLLLLARTALQAKTWGEARTLLTSLLKEKPSWDAYGLLAILEWEEKHDGKAAINWLEKGVYISSL